jgi:hypothetical protein
MPVLKLSVPINELGAVMVKVPTVPGLVMATGLLVMVTPADAPDKAMGISKLLAGLSLAVTMIGPLVSP